MNEVLKFLSSYYLSIPTLIALIIYLTNLIKQYIKIEDWRAWVLSWGVSIALSLFGAGFDLGMFSDQASLPWYWEGVFSGVFFGLFANGIFKVPGVKEAFTKITTFE